MNYTIKVMLALNFLLSIPPTKTCAQAKPQKEVLSIEKVQEEPFKKIDKSLFKYVAFCKPYFLDIPIENIRIKKKKQLIPLTTTPSPLNLFRNKKNWRYKIKISTKTIKMLSPILFDSLSLEGQLGVMAHELSHVSDFHHHKKSYMLKVLFWHLNPRKMDAFEYNTDLICIKHGMGHQLLAWSKDTSVLNGKGTMKPPFKTERYMYPATVERIMGEMEMYW